MAARIREDAASCDFPAIKDPLDEALRKRFICSVANEAVLKAVFKKKDGELTRIRFQEQEHARYRIRLLELLEDNGNIFSFVSSTVSNLDINNSQFQTSNTDLLNNEQFENLLVGFYLTSQLMTASYLRPLIDEIENTMELIDA